MPHRIINVFIVDDSAIVRTTISTLLQNESDIALQGVASDPILAHAKFEHHGWPDVIILDIEMPRMDGLTFLKQIMKERPTPVIICSSVAQKGSQNAIEALSLGAVEVIAKPEVGLKHFLEESHFKLVYAIRAAYEARVSLKGEQKSFLTAKPKMDADVMLPLKEKIHYRQMQPLIAMGSSTGGVQTLEKILPHLPTHIPPIVIVQHMPAGFTFSLAQRLDRLCHLAIKEAEQGDRLLQGHVYIAPGDKHMVIKRASLGYTLEIKDGPKVSRHKPSIDVLFRSVANEAGANGIGFLLTGMGDDGAKGLKEMKERGSKTYAQDEKSCIVYGMPKVAVEIEAVVSSLTLEEIITTIKRSSYAR